MDWKFWRKSGSDRLPKPKELSTGLGKYLVVDLNLDPDWVWQLRVVTGIPVDGKAAFRIYDPVTAAGRGVTVIDYTSLDDTPDLILFDGWSHKQTRDMAVNDRRPPDNHLNVA